VFVRLHGKLQAGLAELESTHEKLRERLDLEINDLLLVQVVIGLEVDSLVRDSQHTVNLNQGQNPLNFEFPLE